MPVHRARGDHHGEITDHEVSDSMLDGECDNIVPGRDPLSADGQNVRGAGMVAVVQRNHVVVLVAVAYDPDEEPDPANPWIRHRGQDLVDAQWRIADPGQPDLRRHVETLAGLI